MNLVNNTMMSGLTTTNHKLEVTTFSPLDISINDTHDEFTTETIDNTTYDSVYDINVTSNISFDHYNCTEVTYDDFNQKLVFVILNSILSLIIITGNMATIVAVLKTPVLGNVSNRFLVSLTMADILVGVLASPLEILTDIPYFSNLLNTDKFFCLLQHVCLTIPARASLTSLTIIMIDRGIYIGSDSLYNNWTTSLKTGIVIVCIWCIAIGSGSVPFFYNQWKPCVKCERTAVLHLVYHDNFESIYLILCWSIMIVSLIFVHSYSHHEQSKMTDEKKVKRKSDLTLINTFGLVFLFSVVCYLPSLIILILTNLDIEIPSYVNDVNSISTQMNSSMNFIVYFAHNKEFRRAFIRILCPRKFIELESKLESHLRQTFETKFKSKIPIKNLTSRIKSNVQLNVINKVNGRDIQEDEKSICLETISNNSVNHSGESRTNQLNKPTLLSLVTALDDESKRNNALNSQNEQERQSLDNICSESRIEPDSESVSNTDIEHDDESVIAEPQVASIAEDLDQTFTNTTAPESIWSRVFSWFTTKSVDSDINNAVEPGSNASSEDKKIAENNFSNSEDTDNDLSQSDRKLWMLNL